MSIIQIDVLENVALKVTLPEPPPRPGLGQLLGGLGGDFRRRIMAWRVPAACLEQLEAGLKNLNAPYALAPVLEAWKRRNAAGDAERVRETEHRIARARLMPETPRPYQEVGAKWMAKRKRAVLADVAGCGKSLMALMAAPDNAAIVVVCPSGMRGFKDRSGAPRGGWMSETQKWRKDLAPDTMTASAFAWPEPGQVRAISYAVLPHPEMLDYIDPPKPNTVLIADEAHLLRNTKTRRTERFRAMAAKVAKVDGIIWGLTANPLVNHPGELESLARVFGLFSLCFGSFSVFKRLFGGRFAQRFGRNGQNTRGIEWGGAPDKQLRPEIGERLSRGFLRRSRAEILPDLPALTITDMDVQVDDACKRVCDSAVRALEEVGIDIAHEVDFARLFRDHPPAFAEIAKARAALATAKTKAAEDYVDSLEAAGEAQVVFCCHLAPLKALAARFGWELFCGSTSSEKRTKLIEDFQAGKIMGLATQLTAGGVGITLTHAAHGLLVDLGWNPMTNEQAIYRLHRLTQQRAVTITRLIADHALDRRLMEILGGKAELEDAVTGALEEATIHA